MEVIAIEQKTRNSNALRFLIYRPRMVGESTKFDSKTKYFYLPINMQGELRLNIKFEVSQHIYERNVITHL